MEGYRNYASDVPSPEKPLLDIAQYNLPYFTPDPSCVGQFPAALLPGNYLPRNSSHPGQSPQALKGQTTEGQKLLTHDTELRQEEFLSSESSSITNLPLNSKMWMSLFKPINSRYAQCLTVTDTCTPIYTGIRKPGSH